MLSTFLYYFKFILFFLKLIFKYFALLARFHWKLNIYTWSDLGCYINYFIYGHKWNQGFAIENYCKLYFLKSNLHDGDPVHIQIQIFV